MPPAVPHFCARCQGVCTGTCVAERRKDYNASRGDDPYRKLYGTARWRRVRARIKQLMPLCVVCGNKPTAEIDHIIPAKLWCAAGNDFWDESNLQGLCSYDHKVKSAKERNELRRNAA